jgi:hypothetical protein
MGRPSDEIFESMIRRGKIPNTPITIREYWNAIQIYGKDLGCLKGKMSRTQPQHVQVNMSYQRVEGRSIVLSVDLLKFCWNNLIHFCRQRY